MTRTENEFKKVWLCLSKKQGCLGISATGDPSLFLNQQGDWVAAGGGGGNFWSLNGNAGTDPSVNFIGTTDKTNVIFKRNNTFSGKLDPNSTAFGQNSNNTGSNTVAIGNDVLKQNTGLENTALGYKAGESTTNESYNTLIGAYSSVNAGVSSSVSLGINALATNSNQFALSDSIVSIKFKGLTYTLPTTLPAGDAVLHCNASGVLTWV